MKKKTVKKLVLAKETLWNLEGTELLRKVAGGYSLDFSFCTCTCPNEKATSQQSACYDC